MNGPMGFPRLVPLDERARQPLRDAEWKRSLILAAVLVVLSLVFSAAREAHGATYKWIDDKGIVHYSDKMPSDAVNAGHVELDGQGRRVKKVDRALTPDELRARADQLEKQKQEAKLREIGARRDRALLASYTREEDLDLARARALSTIESQTQSSRLYASQLTKRQQELTEKKQALGDKPVPVALERELESVDTELAKTNALIETKQQESLAVAAKYDTEKQRWRALRAQADAEAGKVATGTPTNIVPTSSTIR